MRIPLSAGFGNSATFFNRSVGNDSLPYAAAKLIDELLEDALAENE